MTPLGALRQRLMNARADEARSIEILRHALASSEDPKRLRAVGLLASELAETIDEKHLEAVASLKDHVHEKLTRLDLPRRWPEVKRVRFPDGPHTIAPAVAMKSTPWVTDENGVRSRMLYNAADVPPT